jgi:hypothetical protein
LAFLLARMPNRIERAGHVVVWAARRADQRIELLDETGRPGEPFCRKPLNDDGKSCRRGGVPDASVRCHVPFERRIEIADYPHGEWRCHGAALARKSWCVLSLPSGRVHSRRACPRALLVYIAQRPA